MTLRRHRRHQSGYACSSGRGRRFALIAVLSAWILATGVHWDFLQVVGWGRMIVTYTTELDMSLAEAVRYTFSGDARCRICETVTEGKKASNGDPASSSTPGSPVAGKDAVGKLLLSLSPAPLGTPAVSTQTTWFAADVLEPLSPAYPVPVPPPRA